MQYSEEDLIREFELEHKRTESYFDRMYRVIQFTFVAIIAIVIAAFQEESDENCAAILLMLILPVCTYVFGPLYAFNVYALAVGGTRAEAIHERIYEIKYGAIEDANKKTDYYDFDKVFRRYVLNNRIISLISYGVALGCFFLAPLLSILIGQALFVPPAIWVIWLAWVGFGIYLILMCIIVAGIGRNHFLTSKLQRKANLSLKK